MTWYRRDNYTYVYDGNSNSPTFCVCCIIIVLTWPSLFSSLPNTQEVHPLYNTGCRLRIFTVSAIEKTLFVSLYLVRFMLWLIFHANWLLFFPARLSLVKTTNMLYALSRGGAHLWLGFFEAPEESLLIFLFTWGTYVTIVTPLIALLFYLFYKKALEPVADGKSSVKFKERIGLLLILAFFYILAEFYDRWRAVQTGPSPALFLLYAVCILVLIAPHTSYFEHFQRWQRAISRSPLVRRLFVFRVFHVSNFSSFFSRARGLLTTALQTAWRYIQAME
jgi:hypothetical protein